MQSLEHAPRASVYTVFCLPRVYALSCCAFSFLVLRYRLITHELVYIALAEAHRRVCGRFSCFAADWSLTDWRRALADAPPRGWGRSGSRCDVHSFADVGDCQSTALNVTALDLHVGTPHEPCTWFGDRA